MRNPVSIAVFTSRMEFDTLEDREAFEYRPDRRLRWLQRLAIWTLRSLGCFHQSRVERVVRLPFNGPVMEKIHTMLHEYRMHGRGVVESGTRVVMGWDDFAELNEMGSTPFMAPMTFGDPRICGCPVTLVPWMRGVLVVPPERA